MRQKRVMQGKEEKSQSGENEDDADDSHGGAFRPWLRDTMCKH